MISTKHVLETANIMWDKKLLQQYQSKVAIQMMGINKNILIKSNYYRSLERK